MEKQIFGPIQKPNKQWEDRGENPTTIPDPIKPNHYKRAKNDNDVINFCQDNDLDFDQGNVIKYVTRYKHKGGIEDLFKAREYLNRIIDKVKN